MLERYDLKNRIQRGTGFRHLTEDARKQANTFQLTCFLTAAETLSFVKAARQLNVTQPAITHQIRSLEEELNTQLFKRTTRSVEITQEGLIFLNDAKNVLNIITLAKKRFEEPVVDERQFFCGSSRSSLWVRRSSSSSSSFSASG